MTKSELVHSVEAYMPNALLKIYRKSKRYLNWKRQQCAYKIAIKKVVAKKMPLNVVFLVHDSAIWKYDSLYRLMSLDATFNPIIMVCPLRVYQTEKQAQKLLMHTYNTFKSRGYKVIKAANKCSEQSIDVASLEPDIIFYSYLWNSIIDSKYDIYNLRKYLKCYVDYGYCSIVDEWGYSSAFHGLMWRYFTECEEIKTLAILAQPKELRNAVVTGYPMYDEYQSVNGNASMWKDPNSIFKRVIWAPHHTIEGHDGLLKFSTFLEIAELMLCVANEYKNTIQFAFKPHPSLKTVLYRHPNWGIEKTDEYYNNWINGDNTTLVEGPYMDLFKSSNAMIHDCGSFIVEYLYSMKPVMYLGSNREEQSNIVGKKAYNCHYHGTTIEEVRNFLNEVVLKGGDSMKPQREQFYNEVLLPPNGLTVAENIVNEIKKELRK